MQLSDLEESRNLKITEKMPIIRRNHYSIEWRCTKPVDGEWNLTIEMWPHAERVWGLNKIT